MSLRLSPVFVLPKRWFIDYWMEGGTIMQSYFECADIVYLHHDSFFPLCFTFTTFHVGLKRDLYTHKVTTAEHWDMVMIPGAYNKERKFLIILLCKRA